MKTFKQHIGESNTKPKTEAEYRAALLNQGIPADAPHLEKFIASMNGYNDHMYDLTHAAFSYKNWIRIQYPHTYKSPKAHAAGQFKSRNGIQTYACHEFVRKDFNGRGNFDAAMEFADEYLEAHNGAADAYADLGKNMTYVFFVLPNGHVFGYDVVGEWQGISHEKMTKRQLLDELGEIFNNTTAPFKHVR